MATTFGIEEEYLLTDVDSGALVPRSAAVLDAAAAAGDEVSSELNRCQIEIATGVCDELAAAERELDARRRAVTRAGARNGTQPAALASHPFSSWDDQEINTDKERYVRLAETYRQVAWQQAICGCHVHVGIEDPDMRIAVLDRVLIWLPVLLALSANSPYWEGNDTGYASYRTMVWKPWPTAAMPPPLRDFAAYEALVGELEAIEAIESPKSLYWYARPSSAFATLELRVCDVCLRPADAVTIAGLSRALVSTVVADIRTGPPVTGPSQPVLESAMWRAARYGLDGTLVDPSERVLRPAEEVVRRMVRHVGAALDEVGDAQRVHDGVEMILRDGNGAARQREEIAAGGSAAEIVRRIVGG